MFDVGWSEMLLIAMIAVLVIGPKDIPKILYQVGRFFRRLQYMKFAMSQQFDDILRAGDIEELRRGVNFEAKEKKNETDEKAADEGVHEALTEQTSGPADPKDKIDPADLPPPAVIEEKTHEPR